MLTVFGEAPYVFMAFADKQANQSTTEIQRGPPRNQRPAASRPDDKVNQLVSKGFDREKSRRALIETKGDLAKA